MEEVFAPRYFYAAEMWQLIHNGISRRNPDRDVYFEKARKMLKKYVEKRDDEKMEHEFGLDRYRDMLRKLREEIRDKDGTIELLRAELAVSQDKLANIELALDENFESDIFQQLDLKTTSDE